MRRLFRVLVSAVILVTGLVLSVILLAYNLRPFTVNYQLHNRLYDTNAYVPPNFDWQTNFTTVPAPAVLEIPTPFWIGQDLATPSSSGISLSDGGQTVTLQNGIQNVFGLNAAASLC